MAKKAPKAPADKVELYDKIIATNPDVVRKGAANVYTSLNGHMFSFMDEKGELSLRLPKEEREAFIKKYKTKLSFQYNTVMKEYVVVPDELLRKTKSLKKYFDMSYEYAGSLKPKPTTKKKK
jgi:TfoX/Sxy family transcriptional regulator of competence genes